MFYITLTGLSVTAPGKSPVNVGSSSLYPFNVILDSGTTISHLPSSVVRSVASILGATSVQDGLYILPDCTSEFASGSLNFFFSGVEISVPYDELILRLPATNNGFLCVIGLVSDDSGCGVLGDTFLRSAYVVYDLV
jgi:hypothetical protein